MNDYSPMLTPPKDLPPSPRVPSFGIAEREALTVASEGWRTMDGVVARLMSRQLWTAFLAFLSGVLASIALVRTCR